MPIDSITHHRFDLASYERMGPAGVFAPGERVELIRGEIVRMNPIGRGHAECVDRVTELFFRHAIDRVRVRTQGPIDIPPDSQPEPDVTLARRKPRGYIDAHPHPEDVLLVVEVADSSLRYDLRVKVPLYAEAGYPEAWVVDLNSERVHVFHGPDPARQVFRVSHIAGRGQTLTPRMLDDLHIAVDALLPPDRDRSSR